jgi:hypothetical protein
MHVAAAAHDADDVRPNQSMMEYGYTRHLFQIPMPPMTATSSIMRVSSKTTGSTITARSPALNAFMDGEVNKWLTALRTAMKGPGLPDAPQEPTRPTPNGAASTMASTHHLPLPPPAFNNEATIAADGGMFGAGTPTALRSDTITLAALHALDELTTLAPQASPDPLADDVETIDSETSIMSPQPIEPYLSSASPPPVAVREFLVAHTSPPPLVVSSPQGPAASSSPLNQPNFDPQASPLASPNLPTPTLP